MSNMQNSIQLIGNLGKDPEIVHMDGGKKMARVTIATNETLINQKGNEYQETQWHNLVVWGKLAEILENFTRKGSKLAVEGMIVNRNYKDKNGQDRFITEIKVDDLILFGDKNGEIV